MRMYKLEGKSILELKALRNMVHSHPDLTVEEKEANLREISFRLVNVVPASARVETSEITLSEFD